MASLKLRRDNPYINGKIVLFDDNTLALYRGKLVYKESPLDRYYVVSEEDTLPNIAGSKEIYSNSKLWWVIAEVNQIMDPFDLPVGLTLIIPNLNYLKAYNLI